MKLYIITRADLPPGARAAQSCHALRAFVQKCPEFDKEWFENSNNLVVLEVNTLHDLEELAKEITWSKHPWASFHEADFNNELTAIAVGGRARRRLRGRREIKGNFWNYERIMGIEYYSRFDDVNNKK